MSSMWSTCSMSTGHCSTQAPQLVQLHSTSGSMTPPSSRVPTSGRCAWASLVPGIRAKPDVQACSSLGWRTSKSGAVSLAVFSPSRYGALAYRWSRRSMITILGLSGLPVFHAGHWLWHRPHSVQVVKSSIPFQVKSSILPRPKIASSSGSSKSIGSPPDVIGWRGPSAGDRVLPGGGLGEAGGDLRGADAEDAQTDDQDDRLDEVAAALVGPGE